MSEHSRGLDPDRSTPEAVPARRGTLLSGVAVVAQALLLALFVRTFLVQSVNIPTGSLIPSVLVGDYVFVSKFPYGYSRHSFPLSFLPFHGRLFGAAPKRGDIAVFKVPTDNATDYIKRVIGLPGDRIQLIDGELFINGARVARTLLRENLEGDAESFGRPVKLYRETLPGGVSHLIQTFDSPRSGPNNTAEFVVPPDHYFMMGDNRDNSQDSRFWGPVPAENLIGRGEIIYFSIRTKPDAPEETEPAWQFWRWPWTVRTDRLFKVLR